MFDFTISDADMEAIAALDLGRSRIIDHFSADTAKWLNGHRIHD